jgi:hypothetical protein
LLSQFGYQALDLVFNIDVSTLQEAELRQLLSLIVEMEKDKDNTLYERLQPVIEMQEETQSKVQKLLTAANLHN